MQQSSTYSSGITLLCLMWSVVLWCVVQAVMCDVGAATHHLRPGHASLRVAAHKQRGDDKYCVHSAAQNKRWKLSLTQLLASIGGVSGSEIGRQ